MFVFFTVMTERYGDPRTLIVELATLLNVKIDEPTLLLCIKLIDEGVDPKALAQCILNIKKETNSITT